MITGIETTLVRDIDGYEQCVAMIEQLYPKLLKRIEGAETTNEIVKQGIKLKFDDFQSTSVEKISTEANHPLYLTLLSQALARSNGRKIRLIGLNVSLAQLQPNSAMPNQLDLF